MKNIGMRPLLALAALVTFGTVAAACGSDNTQLDDAPVGVVDDTPSFIMTNVDSFPNVAFRCLGVNGIYTTTREAAGAITIVANDPQCGGNPQYTAVSG